MYPVSQAYKDAIMQPSRQFRGRLLIPKLTMNFTRNSIAYKQDGTQVAANAPRYESGKFGKAIMVEEGTTNLFTNSRLLNNGSGWMPYSDTAWVDSSGEYPYIHCETKWDGVYQTLSLSATTYTLTYLVKHKAGSNTIGSHFDGSPSMKIRVDRGAWVDGNIITVPSDGNWHLVEIQATYTTAGSYRVFLQPGRGVTEVSEFYFKYAQIEQKPYATSFIDGTRAAETLTIPTAGVLGGEFTVEFWVKPPQAGRIWGLIHSEGPGDLDGYINANGYPYFWTTNANGNRTAIWSSVPVVPNDWNYIAITIGAGVRKIHVNGQLGAQDNATPQTIGTLWLGTNPEFTYFLNGLIDDLRISNHAKTDEEILAAYREVA